jgi:riboflavin biosynthesis pyrimidine reductase
VQVLLDTLSPADAVADPHSLTDEDLRVLYAPPRTPWLRVNMVSTVDGSATGDSGLSGSINNPADGRVFAALRSLADVIVVGAGTAKAEAYSPADTPIVLVSRKAQVPASLRAAPEGSVLMATCSLSDGIGEARELLGADQVLTLGSHRVDLPQLKAALVERGWPSILCEGGPHLLRDLVFQGAADELTATTVPRLVAGSFPRITVGAPIDTALTLRLLLEDSGTLLGRWFP